MLVTLFVVGCTGKKKDPKAEALQYKYFNLQQVGWKSKTVAHFFNDINYRATEVPIQYYILKAHDGQDLERVDSIYKSMQNERIVEIEFQHIDEKDLLQVEFTKQSYEEAVKYISFQIAKDFGVVTSSGDTVGCAGVTFERNFKVAPFKRLLLHFGNVPPEDTIQLIYQDYLFGNGTLKFNFQDQPIEL